MIISSMKKYYEHVVGEYQYVSGCILLKTKKVDITYEERHYVVNYKSKNFDIQPSK